MARLLRIVDETLERIGMLFLMLLFLVTILQVFCRYVMNNPLPWPEEIGCYLFIWVTYIGLVSNIRTDSHFKIDFIQLMLPARIKAVTSLAFYCLMLWFLAVTAWGSIPLLRASHHILSANSITVNVIYAALPATSVFMMIHLLILIYRKTLEIAGFGKAADSQEGVR